MLPEVKHFVNAPRKNYLLKNKKVMRKKYVES